MCSSPKPKTRAKGQKLAGGSILANMSPEARSRFSQKANAAQERRDEIKLAQKQKTQHQQKLDKRSLTSVTRKAKKQEKSFVYWLLNARLKEVFVVLFLGKSETI